MTWVYSFFYNLFLDFFLCIVPKELVAHRALYTATTFFCYIVTWVFWITRLFIVSNRIGNKNVDERWFKFRNRHRSVIH